MTDNYNLIEAYLNGALSEKEVSDFQQRLKAEPAFLDAYEMRKSMFLLLKHKKGKENLKKKLEVLSHEYIYEEKKATPILSTAKEVRLQPTWLKYIGAAAAVLVLLFVVNTFLPKQNLYEKYAGNIKMDLTQKSATFSFEDIQTAFNAKDYASAYGALAEYVESAPEDVTAYFYLGICALELSKTGEALEIFKIIDEGSSAYQSNGKQFQALTYLKAKDYANCRKVINQISESNAWFGKAQELLEEITEK